MKISTLNKRVFVIADIHGEFNKLQTLYQELICHNNLDLEKDIFIQVGDRNDRGPDTYKVNQFWKDLMLKYPQNTFCVNGNHDVMLIDACKGTSDLMYFNGGNKTERSYSEESKLYGYNQLGHSVDKVGHLHWLKSLPYYIESEDYFFCHAPQALPLYQEGGIIGMDLRQDKHSLTWTYVHGIALNIWVDPNPVLKEFGNDSKILVAGHIHALYRDQIDGKIKTPNPQKIGNTILLDSGCGCHEDAVLSCLILPDLKIVNSKGEQKQL